MSTEPQAPTTPESGPGTSIEKFKTPEDRDKAYLELESFSKEQARRLSDLEKSIEQLTPRQQEQDNRSFTDLYPAAQPAQDQRETELASRLLTRPSEVLRQHAEYVRAEARKEFAQHLSAMEAVNTFKSSNPDLAKHEEIVTMFVRKQPDNLSHSERLKRAAPEARAYLRSIAGTSNPATNLDPSTYVEAPSQQGGSTAAPVAAQPSEEDELTEMIKERSAIQAKKRL